MRDQQGLGRHDDSHHHQHHKEAPHREADPAQRIAGQGAGEDLDSRHNRAVQQGKQHRRPVAEADADGGCEAQNRELPRDPYHIGVVQRSKIAKNRRQDLDERIQHSERQAENQGVQKNPEHDFLHGTLTVGPVEPALQQHIPPQLGYRPIAHYARLLPLPESSFKIPSISNRSSSTFTIKRAERAAPIPMFARMKA